jgi:hypothetical protein
MDRMTGARILKRVVKHKTGEGGNGKKALENIK